MNWRKLSVIAAAAVILPISAYSVQVNSQPQGSRFDSPSARSARIAQRPGHQRHHGFSERLIEELDLSDNQAEQIKEIYEQSRQEMVSLHEEAKEAKSDMQELWSGNSSESQLRRQHDKVQDIHQKMGSQKFDTMLKVRRILTPEQREKMAELQQRRHRNFRNPQR